MTKPFIIWTMRRTGGTSFANLLELVTESKVEHEPFNWERTFGFITKEFQTKNLDIQYLEENLQDYCFSKNQCIKHCYEVVGDSFNQHLIEAFAQENYKHIVLIRRNELLRLISLYTAKQTNVWGKHGSEKVYEAYKEGKHSLRAYDTTEMKSHWISCQEQTSLIRTLLGEHKIDFAELYYEDLYSGTYEERVAKFKEVFDYLETPTKDIENKLTEGKYLFMKAKQNTDQLYRLIPNLEEIKEAFPQYPIEV